MDFPSSASSLSDELETAALRELLRAWHQINGTFFRFALRPPSLELTDATTQLGRWHSRHRAIGLSRQLLLMHPWGVVIEVLKHEMAHQYVQEILGQPNEDAHGPAFRSLCERLGIDAAAAGVPAVSASGAGDEAEERLLGRIARLLALAESPNEHEARAAMQAAQKLLLRYNMELPDARRRDYGFKQLGKPTGRVSEWERALASLLLEHFFVEAIWVPVYRPREGKRGSVLEICGTESNLAFASYVYDFLAQTAERLWLGHREREKLRSNAPRRAFLAGVMHGFEETLRRDKKEQRTAGLVWVGDPQLETYFRRRHPYVRQVRHASSAASASFAQGKVQGRAIVLHRPLHHGPTGGTRLLPRGN